MAWHGFGVLAGFYMHAGGSGERSHCRHTLTHMPAALFTAAAAAAAGLVAWVPGAAVVSRCALDRHPGRTSAHTGGGPQVVDSSVALRQAWFDLGGPSQLVCPRMAGRHTNTHVQACLLGCTGVHIHMLPVVWCDGWVCCSAFCAAHRVCLRPAAWAIRRVWQACGCAQSRSGCVS
jgi:hypothetical protein